MACKTARLLWNCCRRFEGDKLVRRSLEPEVISPLIKGAAEALRGSKAFQAQHRVIALFDAAVVWLDPIIFVATTPMLPLLPEHFRDRSRIGVVPVSRDLFGTTSGDDLSAAEKALGCGHISLCTEHRVNQLPLFIDG